MVSVLHKELECKMEKFKYKKLEVMQLGSVQMKFLQPWLINTVYHLLVKNN